MNSLEEAKKIVDQQSLDSFEVHLAMSYALISIAETLKSFEEVIDYKFKREMRHKGVI